MPLRQRRGPGRRREVSGPLQPESVSRHRSAFERQRETGVDPSHPSDLCVEQHFDAVPAELRQSRARQRHDHHEAALDSPDSISVTCVPSLRKRLRQFAPARSGADHGQLAWLDCRSNTVSLVRNGVSANPGMFGIAGRLPVAITAFLNRSSLRVASFRPQLPQWNELPQT